MSATGRLFTGSTTIASNGSADATARTRPRRRHGPRAALRARHPWHGGVDERLVPEEIQVTPRAFHRVTHRARRLPASRLGTVETGAGPVSNRDARLPPTRVGIAELHTGDVPGVDESRGGGERRRGIHATKTTRPSSPPNPLHPHQTAKGLFNYDIGVSGNASKHGDDLTAMLRRPVHSPRCRFMIAVAAESAETAGNPVVAKSAETAGGLPRSNTH